MITCLRLTISIYIGREQFNHSSDYQTSFTNATPKKSTSFWFSVWNDLINWVVQSPLLADRFKSVPWAHIHVSINSIDFHRGSLPQKEAKETLEGNNNPPRKSRKSTLFHKKSPHLNIISVHSFICYLNLT